MWCYGQGKFRVREIIEGHHKPSAYPEKNKIEHTFNNCKYQ